MTDRTVCCLVISFMAGLLYGRRESIWLCLAVVGFVIWRVFQMKRRYGKKSVVPACFHMILCILLFVTGAYRSSSRQQEFLGVQQYAQEQEIIRIQGTIYLREKKQQQFIYYLKNARIRMGKQYYPCGRIQVYTSKDSYQIGDCIQAEGRYEAFRHPRNEGNFNEEQYYYSKNINLRIKAQSQKVLEKMMEAIGRGCIVCGREWSRYFRRICLKRQPELWLILRWETAIWQMRK